MREIKFRACDKRKNLYEDAKRMYYNVYIISESDVSINGLRFSIKDFEIMQFTGLKDKNGKEIYEGDIVLVDMGYRNLIIIEFKNGSYNVNSWIVNGDCEVIGNIYENPELLRG
ncbi:MAG: hypothetical protein JSW06_02865 [Thermoplasmatales archaeon]|nr:MAG: hypothetical protein JSW06_02865 [Thermoplasmatales archaeon]